MAETGLVGAVERRSVEKERVTFDVTVLTWPEFTVVGRWSEDVKVMPGQNPYAVRYPCDRLGAALHAGTVP